MCQWRSALNYLAGLVAGDGSLYYYKKNKEYFTYVYDNNREFLEKVGQTIHKAMKVSYAIVKPSRTKNYYRLQFTSKKVYEYIRKLLEERLKRPTKNFVRGLIDAEGSVYMDKKARVALQVGLTNYGLAKSLHTWLQRHGYRSTLVSYSDKRSNRKRIYKVYIRGWANVEKLLNEIKPLHPKLREKFMLLKEIRVLRELPP